MLRPCLRRAVHEKHCSRVSTRASVAARPRIPIRAALVHGSIKHARRSLCTSTASARSERLKDVPTLSEFMRMSAKGSQSAVDESELVAPPIPYLEYNPHSGQGRSVFIESYGCQMNVSDTDIVYSIMLNSGFVKAPNSEEADIVFLNTCAIREHAEEKIWARLGNLRAVKKKRNGNLMVGVLGCMAERLKEKLIEEEKLVDLVAGPDAYRDLPRLISRVDGGEKAINTLLSLDETYADITPVRFDDNGVSAYVTIMRGCNNMCTYCIVPFTRGRERSRPASSIEEEVKMLAEKGYKEVILLGQNVNSYNDTSILKDVESAEPMPIAKGFETVYRRPKMGISFTQLVDRISRAVPEMRIRFTSPHPKDFPDDLLHLISERPNVSKALHMPAQSGSTAVLQRMRRGYTREAYLELIERTKEIIPGVAISSDFISGFCGETEEDHKQTLSLMEHVKYDMAFMFAYSMREKTPAHRKFVDDVPPEVKKRRLAEVIETFNVNVKQKNELEVGKTHLVLVEKTSRRNKQELFGRTDTNKKVVFEELEVPALKDLLQRRDDPTIDEEDGEAPSTPRLEQRKPQPGDFVVVRIDNALSGQTLKGRVLALTSLTEFAALDKNLINSISRTC